MTDLDDRLARLRRTPVPAGPDPADLRARASRRRRQHHRRLAAVAGPVAAVVVVLGALAVFGEHDAQSVVTGSGSTTTAPESTPTTTVANPTTTRPPTVLGDAQGLTLSVSPTNDLSDGQLVQVDIGGLEQLSNPIVIQCAGDVTADSAIRDCDLSGLEVGGAGPTEQPEYQASQKVAVRRVIRIPRETTAEDDQGGDYDCATEPAGCALVVGNSTLPAKGTAVALTFVDEEAPEPAVEPADRRGLDEGEDVAFTVTGLRPNSTYAIAQCGSDADAGCDELTWPTAKTDDTGRLRGSYPVRSAIYGWTGRADCTTAACSIVVRGRIGERYAELPIAFADDVTAPEPRLSISPSGPYENEQVVTVNGTGFPAGHDLGWSIGQCPNGKDTSVEERCGYATVGGDGVVDEQGRFSIQVQLFANGACGDPAGCHLGWVLNHGPTLAKLPLTFR